MVPVAVSYEVCLLCCLPRRERRIRICPRRTISCACRVRVYVSDYLSHTIILCGLYIPESRKPVGSMGDQINCGTYTKGPVAVSSSTVE